MKKTREIHTYACMSPECHSLYNSTPKTNPKTIEKIEDPNTRALKDIETTVGIVPGFMKALAEDVLINEWPLFKKYVLGESKIPGKYREMIGLAIAANTRCPYCTMFHTGAAKIHGASDEEIQEIYFLASFTGRWSTMLFAQQYDMEKFSEEFHKIGAHLHK